jgi:hypothetical protein
LHVGIDCEDPLPDVRAVWALSEAANRGVLKPSELDVQVSKGCEQPVALFSR